MAKQVINIGISPNDKSGDPLRSAFNKVNQNFTELYASIEAGGGGGGASVTEGVTPPSAPVSGDLWYDTASGRLYIYFDASWVDASPVDGGASIGEFGEGFSLTASNKIVTNKLYSTNQTQPNQHYRLELDTNGVIHLPDQSIINGSYMRAIHGSYAGLAAGPDLAHNEDSWMWVDGDGAWIATKYSSYQYQWKFDNSGILTTPDNNLTIGNVATPGTSVGILGKPDVPVAIYSQGTNGGVMIGNIDNSVNTGWVFGTEGSLTLPESGTIVNLSVSGPTTGTIRTFNTDADLATPALVSATEIWLETNVDSIAIQSGWIITFASGVQRTVAISTAGIAPPHVGQHQVTWTTPVSLSSADVWPITIQSSDYAIGDTTVSLEVSPDGMTSWKFGDDGSFTLPDDTVQTTAYAGGQGHMMMIDTNRTDTYVELGTADRPFKTAAAAIAAVVEVNPTGVLPYTFVFMGCVVSENIDFSTYNFNFVTVATTCRTVFNGTFTAGNSNLKQLVIRNIEFANTFTLIGDTTVGQFANTSIYNASFSGPVNITTVNNVAFYEAAFFDVVTVKNINYMYINGAQFNTDLTFIVDDSGATAVPANGIAPMIILGFNFIANNVYMTKVGSSSGFLVFQPHMARMGVAASTYTIPAGFIFQPQGCALRGTYVNNGSMTLRNTSTDDAPHGTAPAWTGVIGGDRVVADLAPTSSHGAIGDRVGMIAVSAGYLYICTANWTDGVADIWSRTAISATSW